jgi:hypothetical protein
LSRSSNKTHGNKAETHKKDSDVISSEECTCEYLTLAFNLNMYIGELVTVFTMGGSDSEHGFSGILVKVSRFFLQLESKIGTKPACFLEKFSASDNLQYHDNEKELSSQCLIDIPIDKIVAFIHNKP